jgi:hypothetical protein
MPDTTNIRPLEDLLAAHYGISHSEAREKFKIGQLFGMRGGIVHEGDLTSPDLRLLVYVQSLFTDALRATLGVAPAHRAGRLLERDDFKDLLQGACLPFLRLVRQEPKSGSLAWRVVDLNG